MASGERDAAEAFSIGDMVAPSVTRRIVVLCGLSILAEGYDVGIMGAVVLALRKDPTWQLGPFALGVLSSAALFGMLLGSLVVGGLADRYGRRPLMVFCIALFSLASIGCALASTPVWFGLFRTLGGLGMGGLIPTAAAFTVEYSPRHLRSRYYGIMYSGYSLGIMLVALVAIPVLPVGGWRVLFWIGALPLLLLPLFRLLPKSFDILVAHGHLGEARALAASLDVDAGAVDTLLHDTQQAAATITRNARQDVAILFAPVNLRATLCFWLSLALGLLLVYGFGTWLPTLMRGQGYALGSSLSFLAVFSIASAAGGVVCGILADRFGDRRVISVSFFSAALASLGLCVHGGLWFNYICVALAGYGSVSTALVLTGYATAWYPAAIRSTAIGWALGFGRIGAICGPLLSGAILALTRNSVALSLIAFAVLAMVAGVLVAAIPAPVRG